MEEYEDHAADRELDPPFTVLTPEVHSAPFVFCSPHSGRVYPKSFLAASQLDPLSLRKSEDCYVDALFEHVASMGAPMLAARFPRAYLDVNREPYELDPELFCEPLPDFANSRSVRVAGGLGTLARIVADREDIYSTQLPLSEAFSRIDRFYKPFHAVLAELLSVARQKFGYAVMIDCHSMPSTSTNEHMSRRPDIVLGDRFGSSCDGLVTGLMGDTFTRLGYNVQVNRPYAGGYITEHYGRPIRGIHAIQLEINRGLYLNEHTLELTEGFAGLRKDLKMFCALVMRELPELLSQRAAAE